MWWFFLLAYASYLILGPHWESKLIKGEQLAIVDSKEELGRRSIFISYVALLFISWFLLRPSQSSFMSALILTIADDRISYEIWTRKTIPNASHVDSLPSVSREDVHVSSTLAHDDTRWIVYDDA